MRALTWLWRVLIFIVLFAFALNNQHLVELRGFMGYRWHAPMVFVVLGVFAMGCVTGVLAMLPSWWRHRRGARHRERLMPDPVSTQIADTQLPPGTEAAAEQPPVPAELPFPPDMPAPRKPAK